MSPSKGPGPLGEVHTPLGRFRAIAYIEGWSYLLLLGVAMPLKYFLDFPAAVRIVGAAHGVLFVLFCVALVHVLIVQRWSIVRGTLAFAASLVPFGTFVLDTHLRREQATTSPR